MVRQFARQRTGRLLDRQKNIAIVKQILLSAPCGQRADNQRHCVMDILSSNPDSRTFPDPTSVSLSHFASCQIWAQLHKRFKCLYYGFVKISFHAVCNAALGE